MFESNISAMVVFYAHDNRGFVELDKAFYMSQSVLTTLVNVQIDLYSPAKL